MATNTDFPASYYGDVDGKNPVMRAFKQELKSFSALVKRLTAAPVLDNTAYAKGIQNVVEIWKKYKPRLPLDLYHEHVLQTADLLLGLKLYHVAMWQGYNLYLMDFILVNVEDATDMEHFRECLFPNGFHTDQAKLRMKVRALQGCVQCVFAQERMSGGLTQGGLRRLLHLLRLTRLTMQACQPYEYLSWHLYNGSLYVYDVCRYLMNANYSAQALEFLVWASICLELSVTLATTEFLPWKTTLYCAACQCYYDSNAPAKAERFARRALEKVNELAKLEEQNGGSLNADAQKIYREARIKLSVMVFKHTAFETRTPAGPGDHLLTTRADSPQGPWRRSSTGRLLADLFEGCDAASFLALLEALSDGRPQQLRTRALPEEPQAVLLELLSAGTSILSGTGGRKVVDCEAWLAYFSALTTESTQLELAVSGGNALCLASVLRFLELLFHYERHSLFKPLARHMVRALRSMEGPFFRKAETELTLLEGLVCLQSAQKARPKEEHAANEVFEVKEFEPFVGLVEVLHQCVCSSAQDVCPDGDLVLAAVLNLWARLKAHFQSTELQPLQSKNSPDPQKLLWCLWALYEVASACDLASADCLAAGELALRLALLLEHTAQPSSLSHDAAREEEGDLDRYALSVLKRSRGELFNMMCEVLERGLDSLGRGWDSLQDQTSLIMEPKEGQGLAKEEAERKTFCKDRPGLLSLMTSDLNLELLNAHHSASLKRLQFHPEGVSEAELLHRIRKNKVSKALFLTQKALVANSDTEPNRTIQTKGLLEEAAVLIEKAEAEETWLYKLRSTPPSAGHDSDRDNVPPPAPLLLSSTNHSLTFVPAPYNTSQKVCWYQICGRAASTLDPKVRLGDYSLQGTGQLVPVVGGQCELTVEGLEHNQRYMFAVAAHGSQGALLGNSIGQTTRPMLASVPLPTLSTWGFLAQVGLETGQFAVAKRACSALWNHFTQSDCPGPSPETHGVTQTKLSLAGLNVERLERSSPLLLQWFLTSVFIETDINVQRAALFCDSLSERGPHIWGQNARLAECARLLLAVEVGLWCGDSSSALQAVVGCYGLLAPLIYHQIVWEPMVQVLMRCMEVLEENSTLFKERRSPETSEALLHMVSCITYYLSRALGVLEHPEASQVMGRGQKLLQGLYQAQVMLSRPAVRRGLSRRVPPAGHDQMGLKLRALSSLNQSRGDPLKTSPKGLTQTQDTTSCHPLTAEGDLSSAYHDVMKLKRKMIFLESAALLLQRVGDAPDLVIQWGADIFHCVHRNDKSLGLAARGVQKRGPGNSTSQKLVQGKLNAALPEPVCKRERKALEAFISRLSHVIKCGQQQLQRRVMFEEQRVWRSHLNLLLAQAHLALLHRTLPQLHQRYSRFHPWAFSLAHSGVLVATSSALTHPSPFGNHRDELASNNSVDTDTDEMVSMEGSKDSNERPPSGAGQQPYHPDHPGTPDPTTLPSPVSTPCRDVTQTLRSSLRHAALHLRRAMVLAHRGAKWACLQHACRTVWEQSSSLAGQTARDPDPRPPAAAPCPITLGLLNTTFTPLLVLATDLLMDMMDTLGLWKEWEGDASQEDLESGLASRVDLSWVQALVLDTLGRLHAAAKWESLAHYALLFNCYTRGRHTLRVSPLLVQAQRRLLERISEFGGPPVPQPHHAKTLSHTETPVTWKNYAGYQLLSGWSSASLSGSDLQQPPTPYTHEELKAQEVLRAMSLVRVPLGLEDTLAAYRLALQNRPPSLRLLQHSRTLLHLLLAGANLTAGVQQGGDDDDNGGGGLGSPGQVEICPVVTAGPDPEPPDLTRQDFATPSHLYSLPLGPQHTHTVIAAYSASIKLLESGELKVQALHDLGNLQLYAGQMRAARASWSRAVDCALRSAGVLDTWDGESWAGGARSQQDTLKLAGVWGCLQAAVIAAKTAQFMLTSHIHQRTMCCLLSAHLFKCVLCSSQPHPQRDLLYASHGIGEELLPGVDLFYDPIRVHPPTTVASLHFLCHWLYSTRHYVTLLPMLALYLYFVRIRCRDVHRTVEGTLLKVRALTELSMFGQAVKEAVELSHGQGVTLPYGPDISQDSQQQPSRKFHDNKPILENLQAVEDLLNCRLSQEVRGWYGPVLCRRFRLAQVQLVLALCQTLPGLPVPGPRGEENTEEPEGRKGNQGPVDTETSGQRDKEPGSVELAGSGREKPSLGRLKWVLLDWVHRLLESSGGPTADCESAEYCSSTQQDLEIAIETHLLLSNMHLQLGHAALSADMAAKSLELLQTSPSFRGDAPGTSPLSAWVSEGPLPAVPSPADCHRAVEAGERLGAPLWLSCRLALHWGLAARFPGTAVRPGPDISEQTARVLKESLNECVSWGDPDTRALMLLAAAAAHTSRGPYRGQSGADPSAMLSEAVSLLSDRTRMPAASSLALALATMQLSALRGTHSTALLERGQRLLQQQLTVFGESVEIRSGGVALGPQGFNNIYLPQLPLLARTTMHIGHVLALRAAEMSANPAPETSSVASAPDTQGAPAAPPAGVQSWSEARKVLDSALGLSRSCARRDMQLEARLLYCRGVVERSLRFYGQVQPEEVARTLVDCIQTTMTHSHNLQVLHQCYLEVAFLFLQDMPTRTPSISAPTKGSYWRNLVASLKRRLTAAEKHLLPFWVCLRAAHTVTSSMRRTGQLAGSGAAEEREGGGGGGGGGALSSQELNTLPDFAKSDLLHPCGGVSQTATDAGTNHSYKEDRSTNTQLTWTHLARYFTHLLNLQHAASAGVALLAGDASIAARLSQLHSFYCEHSSRYRETCCPPQPVPSHIMLQAPPTQEEEEEVYTWSISPRPQLCVQWYKPCLTPSPGTQDTVILLYGYNSHPISATGGSANDVLGLQCGHYVVNIDSVRALHAELSEVCALADIRLSVAHGSLCTSSPRSQSPAPADDKTMTVLRDRTLACCRSIQELLQPRSRPASLTQVPFEVSLDNVSDLERCFDASGGAVLQSSLLTEWILAMLINS